MNDNKKDITKIGDLESWEHTDDETFSTQETKIASQSPDKENLTIEPSEFSTFEEELDLDQDFKSDILESPFSETEINSTFEEVDPEEKNDSITLLSELHQYDSENEYTNVEKELTTIKEINQEINSKEKLVNIHEPISPNISRNIPLEASPSFSLILKNIAKGQKNKIKEILIDSGMDEYFNDQILDRAIKNKELLIPRISEYMGVTFIHKFKNLNLQFELCLSSSMESFEFDPMDNGTLSERTDKFTNIQKNIITSKTSTIDNYDILKIGDLVSIESQLNPKTDHTVEKEYVFLTESLKLKAIKNDADAIIGLTFQHYKIKSTGMIKVVISGSLAWIK